MKRELELERELIYEEANGHKIRCLILKTKLFIIKWGGEIWENILKKF